MFARDEAGIRDPGYANAAKAKKSPSPPFCSNLVLLNAIHPRLVFRACCFVFFALVVFAQHFSVGVHLEANLFAVLLNHGFKVSALLLPTNNCPALGLRLGS